MSDAGITVIRLTMPSVQLHELNHLIFNRCSWPSIGNATGRSTLAILRRHFMALMQNRYL
jgi:hypothetical protein